MKENIFAVFTALIVLLTAHDLLFSHKGKILLLTNAKAGTEVSVQYTGKNGDKKITVKAKADLKGKVRFELKEEEISWFKILPLKGTVISAVKFRAWKTKKIILNGQNEYTGKTLKSRIDIDWYNLIVFAGLGYYFAWFLAHSLKYGFPKDASNPSKMMNIEFLRIVFTLCVVFHHLLHHLIPNRGGFAVEFFFVLSGFLLAYTFNNEKTVLSFLKSKIIRFLPLTIFVCLIKGIFLTHFRISDMVAEFLFLPCPGLHSGKLIIGVTWYLRVLLWASLFYFYLIKVCKRETVNIITGVMIFICYTAVQSKTWGGTASVNDFIKVNMVRALGAMGIGYFLKQFIDHVKVKPSYGYNLFEGFILIYIPLSMFIPKINPMNFFYYLILFFILLFCFVQKRGKVSQFFEKPVFTVFSRYCFSVYMTHTIITHDIMIHKYPVFVKQNIPLSCLIVFISACLLGFIAHHTIELPATKALKKWWR